MLQTIEHALISLCMSVVLSTVIARVLRPRRPRFLVVFPGSILSSDCLSCMLQPPRICTHVSLLCRPVFLAYCGLHMYFYETYSPCLF